VRTSALTLPHAASSASRARRVLDDQLDLLDIPDDTVSDALLAITELVGNAVRHARPRADGALLARWQIDLDAGLKTLRIDVVDGGSESSPQLHHSSADEPSGRGLAIVAAVAGEWGVEHQGPETRVWARFCW
jgi:anti-sigma regulatory factor (Ser/Thr protein kinase)